jgi:hypothetical protein
VRRFMYAYLSGCSKNLFTADFQLFSVMLLKTVSAKKYILQYHRNLVSQ